MREAGKACQEEGVETAYATFPFPPPTLVRGKWGGSIPGSGASKRKWSRSRASQQWKKWEAHTKSQRVLQNMVYNVHWKFTKGFSNNDNLIYIFKVYSDCWGQNGLWLVIKIILNENRQFKYYQIWNVKKEWKLSFGIV